MIKVMTNALANRIAAISHGCKGRLTGGGATGGAGAVLSLFAARAIVLEMLHLVFENRDTLHQRDGIVAQA